MAGSAGVARGEQGPPPWLEPVCQVCRTWKLEGATVQGAFEAAVPDLSDPARADFLLREAEQVLAPHAEIEPLTP